VHCTTTAVSGLGRRELPACSSTSTVAPLANTGGPPSRPGRPGDGRTDGRIDWRDGTDGCLHMHAYSPLPRLALLRCHSGIRRAVLRYYDSYGLRYVASWLCLVSISPFRLKFTIHSSCFLSHHVLSVFIPELHGTTETLTTHATFILMNSHTRKPYS
jgi:hypothetical protein